ncbi:MAG: SusD/RagB family nutrient-binding outer membrane lipoprotein [Bacteroidales bacterium]|nr:SusD/RagB family nutrient-binding outer membrane lipoprotein [Bacteroidales bacterium]
MKNIFKKLIGISFVVLFLFGGCTKDFDEMNISPNQPSDVLPQYLLTSAEKNLVAFMWDEWWNGRFGNLYCQYWSQTSYTDESRYSPRDGVLNNYWIYFYAGRDVIPDGTLNGGGMEDLQRIIKLNTDEETKVKAAVAGGPNMNQIAAARILKVWMFQILTDIWGYIPYSQALQGFEIPSPVYDSQESIYNALITEITEAQAQIDVGAGAIIGDIIYGGDMAKWKKFANSLKMRIAMRMSKADPTGATTAINEALTAGPFTSIDDNAVFTFLDGVPINNPLNENQKTRQDFAVSNTLIDFLKSKNDPRLPFYANGTVSDPNVFTGFPYGMDKDEAAALSTTKFSMPGNIVYAPTAPAFYMLYDEVEFIKAEAVALLGVTGDAQASYEAGIKASMEFWNLLKDNTPTGWSRIDNCNTFVLPASITNTEMDAYIASPEVAWNPGNAKQLIAEQKYIALYPSGLQAWFEYNRSEYIPDILIQPGDSVYYDGGSFIFSPLIVPADNRTPHRMYYPSEEQDLNGVNRAAAVAAQGADVFSTKLWWQK